ncbi:MAG: glycosyl transferase family 2 [Elusimicrobia bacterium HGW-Elusimicrobia-1]|jgi:dolichyl-phosphate beta-glucosyltransferase|nr:MAG: glycosyl transferase family 2 [Elusimicrobia bacterium HGW-Elusimicrobia-1]
MNISVIIPAFNEEKRLGPTIERMLAYLAADGGDFEILVVDDGSADGTAAVAESFAARGKVRLIRSDVNRGKGFSVKRGVEEARMEFILFSDADLSTPIEELSKLKSSLDGADADMAAGSRAATGADVALHQPFYREMMGKVFNKIARTLTFGRIKDSQCGFKLFRKNAAKKLFALSRIDGFAFDAEIIFLAQKKGFGVVEVPVRWINNPNTRVSAVRDSVKMLVELVRIRINYMLGRYD